MSSPQPAATTHTRLGSAALVLGLVAAAMWLSWLGWDDEYYEVDGVPQGPYRAWQVIGCALSIAAAAVAAQVLVRGVGATFVLSAAAVLGFAVPWSVAAAASDDSGLWVVGLLLLLVGGGIGLTVLLSITGAVAAARRPRGD